MGDREAAIQAAISDIDAGVFLSQRAAAKAYNIPQSTISTRIRGRQSNQASHVYQQRLTPEQEDFLVQWILEEDARAFPPSHARAREMANRILRMNGDHRPVGKHWMAAFLKRNPRVASVVGRKIEAARAEGATPVQISAFLELFERTRTRLGIRAEDIWNMDETGKALGVCANTRVLASSQKKKAYHQSPENREWASVIECVSATGKKLRCSVIFKGKSLQSTWFPAIIPEWLYTASENGWTSNAIGVEWLERVFLPETALLEDRWRMLILDGHGSHISLDFLWTCKKNKVYLLFLPAHASHILQPLDLSVFSVVKRFYRQQIQALSYLDDAAPVKKERFITAYYHARERAITKRVIREGWATAGICPFNIDRVVNSSQVT
ncbi:HTH-Tnp-Tc5 multi-domain protein [Pyrenophora tritici-repentis]|uniref:HTH-Tnp-Tc5 multi-domain protein n=1 Tax=Pyrenophora tritici-repentis TaxID=45151 RepID=A0A834RHM9_9PLEO|nr:HTH-Tnp-Tc5 multi-domain protein [Pyrenophora tritici-repentis]